MSAAGRLRVAFDIPSRELIGDIFDERQLARLHRTVDLVAGPDADVVITGWGSPAFDADELARRPSLRALVHAAGSVKRLVTPDLWARGIRVSSCATANGVPVAEYTLATILLSAKDVFGAAQRFAETHDMHASRPGASAGAYGITVGIVGASRIGRRVIDLLRPFDVDVVVYDPSLPDDGDGIARRVPLERLLEMSDVVSLHAPSLPETRGMIGAPELARMRDGAVLINTARGALVDTDALVTELARGRLRAVLDVTDPEPLPPGHPLFSLPGVVLTPHIAGSLGNELGRIGAQVVDEVVAFATDGALRHEITPSQLTLLA